MSSEEMSGQVRQALAAVLAGFARGLSASARLVEQASWILRPRQPAADPERESETVDESAAGIDDLEPVDAVEPDVAEAVQPDVTDAVEPDVGEMVEPDTVDAMGAGEPAVTEAEPAAEPPPTVPAPEGADRARVAESHIAALADRPVADVVSEISGLSTDELEDLYAYEVTHKNRKTVLRAIERAVAPAS